MLCWQVGKQRRQKKLKQQEPNMQHNKKAHSSESSQQHLEKTQQQLAELKKRMGYEPPPLSQEEQNQLDAKFRNSYRQRKWVG
jgi:hypothetical protein